jgi:hypothetical protein
MTPAFMETIYCDDVRAEIGNKLSFMGVYGSNLLLSDFPAALPKFCAVMSLYLPVDAQANAISFSLCKDGEEIGRTEVPPAGVREAATRPRAFGDEMRISIRFIAQLAPLRFERPGRLEARALVDGETIAGGTLIVEKGPSGAAA